MEGFQSGQPGNLAAEVERLLAEKVSLEEELMQCKADKDFVWNLWKRLQTEKPDMASVISMVVAREKEKIEKKDKKVLEVLRMKDEKIMEMRQVQNSDKEESKINKERLHELLIENDELKQKLDERENERFGKMNEMEERTKEIEEKNRYLQQLVKAYQEEKESKDKELQDNLEDINKEKNGLRTQVKELESKLGKLTQDKTSLDDAMKTNFHLQEQIQDMEKNIEELTRKSEEFENQHEEAITALKLRESQLQEESKAAQFLSGEVKDKERELIRLRAEIAESKNGYDQAMGMIKEQTEIIEQLQVTQDQLYRVIEDHKQSYEKDIASIKQTNEDLQLLCTQYQSREEHLHHEIGVLRQEKASHFEDVINKERLIEELQNSLDEPGRGPAASPTKRARLDSEACRRCKELGDKLEVMKVENEELSEALQERSRRISSLQKTLKTTITSRRSSDKQSPGAGSQRMEEEKDGTGEVPTHDQIDTLLRKLDRCERRIEDHKRLLDLKDSELNEVRRAHNQRHQRYRLLKENYELVQNQLRTFENEPRESTPPERPSEHALRHENSDGVWNELTYYRGEFEKLSKERHEVLEELDVLRVEHANDLTTIQELKLCLEEEKEGLLDKLNEEHKRNAAKSIAEARKTASLLKEEIAALKDLNSEYENKINGLDEEVLRLQQENKSFIDDNVAFKKNVANLERQLEAASQEIEDRIEESENLRMDLVEKENRPARSPVSKSPTFTKRRGDDTSDRLIKQQAKDIDIYDQQLKKIAQKILSPSKQTKSDLPSISPRKESQATQTLQVSRTADFSSSVDFDHEGDEEIGICEVDARRRVGESSISGKLDTSKKLQTPRGKKGVTVKKTPVRGEWASMKQRILSLTQQVAALRSAKDKALKALNEERAISENLRSEFNTVLQRLQVSKNTIQTLNEDLRKCMKEKEELKAEEQIVIQQDNDAEIVRRRQEERLKTSGNELSRLTCIVKTLRNENKELKEKLSDTQERLSRVEKDLAQKKTFVEEMKTKLRKTQDTEERYADTVKELEEKIRRLMDRETQKKMQIDSLKRQLEAETREKGKFQQQYYLSQEEAKKKTRLLSDTQCLRGQAEKAVTEMEAAATQQLQGLANKSEMAIKSIRTKLNKANDMIEEFQALIKTLSDELLADIERAHYKIYRLEEQAEQEELRKPASRQARDLACSILNMTSDDLDDFMKEDDNKSEERAARKQKENEWKNRIDSILRKEVSFAVPLLEILLQIIEGRKSLEGQLIQLSNTSQR